MSTDRQTDTNLTSTGLTGILALRLDYSILHRDTRAHFVSAPKWILYNPYLGDEMDEEKIR
jgi:hypothetical protein